MDKSRYTIFHDKCGEIEQRFGRQGKLPLRSLDMKVIRCVRLLDFGAGKGLNSTWCREYYTLDTDESLQPSFTSIDQAKKSELTFDAVIANQVFEHIPLDDIDSVVQGLAGLMNPEAVILATIPNVHRGTYFFNDIDHKTPLMYYHLSAFFEMNGLQVVDAYRYTKNYQAIANANADTKRLMDFLERMYELDPAQFIAVIARKL
jgi:methyltransferase family protein